MKRASPINKERPFEPHEMFFSITDPRGIIKSCNAVFVRVSGHPTEALIGAPHNVIRHPDMPKVVFKLLWSTIQSGRPICAYVKNMACDGSYYWVLATVFPCEGGYLSVRVKPEAQLLPTVASLYAEILAEEKKGGVEASGELLLRRLGELGFADYATFMTHILVTELRARNAARRGHKSDSNSTRVESNEQARLSDLVTRYDRGLSRAFARIELIEKTNTLVEDSIGKILKSFNGLGSLSINMMLAASRLGNSATTLSVISESFQKFASDTEETVARFGKAFQGLKSVSSECAFRIASAYLQNQMLNQFSSESRENTGELTTLIQVAVSLLKETCADLAKLETSVFGFCQEINDTETAMTALEIVRQTGRMESMRIAGAEAAVGPYITELQKFSASVRGPMRGMAEACELLLKDLMIVMRQVNTLISINPGSEAPQANSARPDSARGAAEK